MSRTDAIQPLARPPGSTTRHGGAGEAEGPPARPHDHDRPFPPPRLPAVHVTAPLTPLSGTFRSRPQRPAGESPNGGSGGGGSNDTTPPRSPIGEVSLAVPRPDGERAINEYVEAPFKHPAPCQERRFEEEGKRADCPKIRAERRQQQQQHRRKGIAQDSSVAATHARLHAARTTRAFLARGSSTAGTNVASVAAVTDPVVPNQAVTKQPVSFTKEPAGGPLSTGRTFDPAGLSIMCNFCGRCRCESCREPPPLPSKWLCDNKCFCSADTILDYASCLCCVKGLFYHCVDGGSSGGGGSVGVGVAGVGVGVGVGADTVAGSCADEPCSCTGNRMAARWACLGALTLLMPCLLCYWPFKGCVQLCEICYARHAAQGCRCNPAAIGSGGGATAAAAGRHHPIGSNDIGDSRDPEKRLLDPVTPEL